MFEQACEILVKSNALRNFAFGQEASVPKNSFYSIFNLSNIWGL